MTPIITNNHNGTVNISAGILWHNANSDWAEPSIKLQALHKELEHAMNLKHHSEAFSILLDIQAENLKLMQYVLYGIAPKDKIE